MQKYFADPISIFKNEQVVEFCEIEFTNDEASNDLDQENKSMEDKEDLNNGQNDFAEPSVDNGPPTEAPANNNLDNVINIIRFFMAKFEGSPLNVDRQSARILDKYPKYLTKFSLLE